MKNEKNLDPRCEELLEQIAQLIYKQPPEKQKELIEKYATTDRP